MSAINLQPFPRWPLLAAGFLMSVSILAAGFARYAQAGAPTPAAALSQQLPQALAARTLRFEPTPEGGLRIVDVQTGTQAAVLKPEDGGFIQGAMRGLRRTRMVNRVSPDPVLTVARWPDGRFTASDVETGTVIDLAAFGADNRAAFAALLPPSPTSAPPPSQRPTP